jgi:hypothetical protein
MNHIIYLLDSLTPLSLNKCISKKYKKFKKKENYIDQLSKNSIFFENAYGYGETYPTTFSMFTGKDIYNHYCDAWNIFFSFRSDINIAKYYKSKKFKTIYYRNCEPNAALSGSYERYLNSVTRNFDVTCYKKKYLKYNFNDFLHENNLASVRNKKENFLFLIHDFSLHDYAYAQTSDKKYLQATNLISEDVKKNLNLINYNSNKDILFFLSDHGLTSTPNDQIFFNNNLSKEKYNSYYKSLFVEEKIRFTFFIKTPENKKKVIKNTIISTDVFNIIKFMINKKKGYTNFFYKISKLFRSDLFISLRDAIKSPYNSSLFRSLFHCHFVYIKNHKKFIYSHNYPQKYLQQINHKFYNIDKNIIPKKFLVIINNYFSSVNLFKKIILINISILALIYKKILKVCLK